MSKDRVWEERAAKTKKVNNTTEGLLVRDYFDKQAQNKGFPAIMGNSEEEIPANRPLLGLIQLEEPHPLHRPWISYNMVGPTC